MTGRGFALALAALAGAVAACDNGTPPPIGAKDASGDVATMDAGGDAQPAGDGGTEAGPACTLSSPPANQACATCLQDSCCAGANACLGNADCEGYVACVRACTPADAGAGDAAVAVDGGGEGSGFACAKGCMKQFPNGVNAGIVLIDCEDNACAGKCN